MASDLNLPAVHGRRRGRPDPSEISDEAWQMAEETVSKVVLPRIHPTLDADEKRSDILEYIQQMISDSFAGVQVFPYGSVPLKTYLPDGDVDMTVICKPEVKDSLPNDVYALLRKEELNAFVGYRVRDTEIIDAEVKVVKCNVENIMIDISFNQLGGLSTLCFLEKVDHIVNKNHLFKRSVLLIKAWCHYESRILGAYHGLLSTYALESLILCIFQLFSTSLDGPLAVLYRFLDYYSRFDWENYCISLDGPVRTSSLPDVFVADPENGGAEFLLSTEKVTSFMDLFAVSSNSLEYDVRTFAAKHLNIIDPLQKNNNLGRSVHRGNYLRIHSAFKYGAKDLGDILLSPRDRIADAIKAFFECNLARFMYIDIDLARSIHSKSWLAEEGSSLETVTRSFDLTGDYESHARSLVYGRCCLGYSSTIPALRAPPLTMAQCRERVRAGLQQCMTEQWSLNADGAVLGQCSNPEFNYVPSPTAHGTGNYIPDTEFKYRERTLYRRLINPVQETGGHRQRLVDNAPDPSLPGTSSADGGEEEPKGKAVEEGKRIMEKPIDLNSQQEFPPLK